ncbi:hypothetical protein [Allorhizobium borbori]|uniref:Lipoprotein n=1 Tax=Allorhizobium borbori TaxID=485907 RepID=A0A7W6K382_9HYPH|nr:hypothetical protein [Allorhizobium borbori]MBB4104381.1 hypothetical protein [Allorhizobium borbori]
MKTARSMLLLTVATLLAACQSMTPEQRRAADEGQCLNYGFRRGTEAFAECLQRIDLDRRAEARASSIRASQMMWEPPLVIERRVIVRK